MIRAATVADADAIRRIYNHYVANTVITFEEERVSLAEMARRIEAVRAKSLPWLVDELEGAVVGYTYAAPWVARSAYRFTLETTVYLEPAATGEGRGTRLYGELLELLPATGAHSVLGVIALPNPGSVALHEKFGFVEVGHFSEVGLKFDRWIDVGMWQTRLQGSAAT